MNSLERKRMLLKRAHDAIGFALTNPHDEALHRWLIGSDLEPFDDDWRMSEIRLLRWAEANLSAALKIVRKDET